MSRIFRHTFLAAALVLACAALAASHSAAGAAALELKPNTVVVLTPGVVYDSVSGLVGPYYAMPDGCNLVGRTSINQPYPIIRLESTNQGYAFKFVKPFRMTGVRVERGGVFAENAHSAVVDDVEIATTITGSGIKRNALEFSGPHRGLTVTRSAFENYSGGGCLYFNGGAVNSLIANIEVSRGYAGVKGAGDFTGTRFEQIWVHDITQRSFEIQGRGNPKFLDCWVENNVLSATSANNDAYSYSIPLAEGADVYMARCVSIQKTWDQSPAEPWPGASGRGVRIIFEIGGKNFVGEDCYSAGGNHVIAGNGANGSGVFRNSRLVSYRQAPSNSWGNTTQYSNLGPNVQLSTIMEQRLAAGARPQRFKRYEDMAAPPGDTPPPATQPTTRPVDPIKYVEVVRESGKVERVTP